MKCKNTRSSGKHREWHHVVDMACEPSCSVTMSDRRIYRSFVIMLADATRTTSYITVDASARCWCSFAVYGCMGRKI